MSKRYRLLFVDDEARVLRSLTSVFRRDYDVFTASGGFEALEMLASESVDVIVSDQRMPNMTGDELLSIVHQKYPQIMRILLTGYVDKKAIINTINEGEIFRFISKPWNVDELKRVVAQAAAASQHQLPPIHVLNPVVAVSESKASATNTEIKPVSAVRLPSSAHQDKKVFGWGSALHSLTPSDEKTAIVLMDKSQEVRNSVRAISRRLGFDVYTASSYMQAVRTLALRKDVGVAIIGLAYDPRETVEAVNLLKRNRVDLCIIALADFVDAGLAIQLINEGQIFRYLEKPVDGRAFERAVGSAISRHKMLQQITNLNARYKVEVTGGYTTGIEKLKSFFKKSA
jgi:DNA-binding NtrC family response regulator